MSMFHYTCSHGYGEICAQGLVKPNPLTGLAWFTDLTPPIRSALGLTSQLLTCDRMEFCVQVDPGDVTPWVYVRRAFGRGAKELESAPGAMPMHWYVSPTPVRILR